MGRSKRILIILITICLLMQFMQVSALANTGAGPDNVPTVEIRNEKTQEEEQTEGVQPDKEKERTEDNLSEEKDATDDEAEEEKEVADNELEDEKEVADNEPKDKEEITGHESEKDKETENKKTDENKEITGSQSKPQQDTIKPQDDPSEQGLYDVYKEGNPVPLESFTTLKDAVAKCNTEGDGSYKIVVKKDDLNMGEGAVIEGGGKKITLTSGDGAPYIIRQTIAQENSDSLETNARQRHISLFYGSNTTTLTLENVILEGVGLASGGGKNGGVRVGWNANVVVGEGAIIRNCYWDNGGAICVVDGTVTVDNGTLTNNKAQLNGGGIHASSISNIAIINGSSITNNTANDSGGGVVLQGNSSNKVTVSDSNMTQNMATLYNGGAIFVENGEISVTNSKITKNVAGVDGGGIRGSGVTVTLENSQIDNNEAKYGAGVSANNLSARNTTITMSGGSISHNICAERGGGVNIDKDTIFTMNGGQINQNSATGNGGGVVATAGSQVIVNEGEISNNTSEEDGGGFFVENGCYISLGGKGKVVSVVGNQAKTGGGVYTHAPLDVKDVSFLSNKANVDGGGIYAKEVAVSLIGVTMSENKATIDGGAFRGAGVTVILQDSTIRNNEATHGAGVSVNKYGSKNSSVTMDNTAITDNTSSKRGGGVNIDDSTFTMNSGTIGGNEAETGGGVIASLNATFTLNTGEITDNIAHTHGGGLRMEQGSHLDVSGGVISGNEAGGQGGGVYIWTSARLNMSGGKISENMAAGDGGGVFTEDFAYEEPLMNGYENISVTGGAIIEKNTATGERQPFPHLDSSKTIDFAVGLLDNYEINYYPEWRYITYHPNNGSGEQPISKRYGFDSDVILESPSDKGINFSAPVEGHEFKYWNTQADGQGESYFAGGIYQLENSTDLYAIWGEPKGIISGVVFQDVNRDGEYTQEELLSNRVVTLYKKNASGDFLSTGITTNTTADGQYEFEVDLNETYKVSFKVLDRDVVPNVGETGFIKKGEALLGSHVYQDGFSDPIPLTDATRTHSVNAGYAPPFPAPTGIEVENTPWIFLLSLCVFSVVCAFFISRCLRKQK